MEEHVGYETESLYPELRAAKITARVIAIILTVLFGIGALFNIYVLVNSFLKQHGYPSAFGITPIVVVEGEDAETEKIEDIVKPGDLLFALERNMKDYEADDVVAFTHNGGILIGRITEIESKKGNILSFTVQAAYSENPFEPSATVENLLGDIDYRIPQVGYFILFLATLPGRILFVGIPMLIYLILLILGAWMEAREYRRARMTVLRPCKWDGGVPLGEVTAWSFLTATVLILAAVCYGTADSRATDRMMKKRMAAAHTDAVKPEPHTQPVTHPVRMRHTRAIKPQKRKPARPLSAVRPAVPIRPTRRID